MWPSLCDAYFRCKFKYLRWQKKLKVQFHMILLFTTINLVFSVKKSEIEYQLKFGSKTATTTTTWFCFQGTAASPSPSTPAWRSSSRVTATPPEKEVTITLQDRIRFVSCDVNFEWIFLRKKTFFRYFGWSKVVRRLFWDHFCPL